MGDPAWADHAPEVPSSAWPPLAILAAGGLFAAGFVLVAPIPRLVSLAPDDACYFFEIAQNLSRGQGATFDGLHRTNGFQPLWLCLLAGVARLLGARPEVFFRAGLLLGTLLLTAGGWMLLSLLRRCCGSGAAALCAVLFVFLVLIPAANGMESGLLVFMLCVILRQVTRQSGPAGRDFEPGLGLGLLLGLLVLTRLDLIFLPMVFFGWYGLRVLRGQGRWRALLISGGGFALLFGAYLAWNVLEFGDYMPLSGRLKSSFPRPLLDPGRLGLLQPRHLLGAGTALLYPVWLLIAGGLREARGLRRAIRGGLLFLATANLLHLAHTLLFMKWAIMPWHFIAYDLLLALVAWDVTAWVVERFPARILARGLALGVALLLIAGTVLVYRRSTRDLTRSWHVASYAAACWARDHLPPAEVLAMKDAGIFGFFSERQVINLDGLVNDREYQEELRSRRLGEYLRRNRVGYLVQHALWDQPEVLSGRYENWRMAYFSQLHDSWSEELELRARDEVYRGAPYLDGPYPSVLLIWKLAR